MLLPLVYIFTHAQAQWNLGTPVTSWNICGHEDWEPVGHTTPQQGCWLLTFLSSFHF
ncbi:unnamed protein product [Nezara viridula]|uniref:Uncharacterized protein n=1 Tax=Nezara viridula TaxID=85310 RepID=A0A9P0H6N0_NEZVI|nr:unnamed protein product [Nezara viridula]